MRSSMNIEDRLLSLCASDHKKLPDVIPSICTDSRKVVPGSVFVAIRGRKTDGHNYLESALQKGAQVLVVEDADRISDSSFKGMFCVVPNTKDILPVLLNEFYNYPSEKMFCIGITGTNGKTTTSYMLSHLLSYCGWQTGLIGTIKSQIGDWEKNNILTTPDPAETYYLLDKFYKRGAQAAIMEVSSIGLEQDRVKGLDFNLGVFTNLSQDHLDYHGTISNYFQAKKKLFHLSHLSEKKKFLAILNLDDPFGVSLAKEIRVPYISYGKKSARFSWEIISTDLSGTRFKLFVDQKEREVYLSVPGIYNVSNAVAALCCVYAAGFSLEKGIEALKYFPGVSGRLERVKSHCYPMVFVDYAHTPKALEAVLLFINSHKKDNSKLVTVFGCGGERDKEKRPLMTQVAERYSDKVFLTSDNPRGEDPMNIIEDCIKGVTDRKKITVEVDREQAILRALKESEEKDIVLIAGKGHERLQIIGTQRQFFSDKAVVEKYFSR